MSGLGTDVVALACILGGAAVGGVVSLAAWDGGAHEHEVLCTVEAQAAPRVVVAMGGDEKSIVVAPRVQVHSQHGCEAVVVDEHVRVRMDEARMQMERARDRMERARVRLERVDRAELEESRLIFEERMAEMAGLNIEMEGLDIVFEGLGDELEAEIEERLRVEMEELEKRLERLDDEIGR